MVTRSTITIPGWMEELLNTYVPTPRSRVITALLIRYEHITDDAAPSLTMAEWGLLMRAGKELLSSNKFVEYDDIIPLLCSEESATVARKMGIISIEFAARLNQLPLAGKYALCDVITRFWYHQQQDPEKDVAALLEKSGAKIAK